MDERLSPRNPSALPSEAISVLLEPRRRRYLEPFFASPKTVSEAAKELGIKANSLLYQVRRLETLGLLNVAFTEARRGRAITYYQTAREQFFIPFEHTDAVTLEELLFKTNLPRARRFAHHLARAILATPEATMGYLIGRQAGGEIDAYFSPDGERVLSLLEPQAPAAGRSWVELQLSHEDAKAFQGEQWLLWDKYLKKRGGQRYLAHFDLTPVTHD